MLKKIILNIIITGSICYPQFYNSYITSDSAIIYLSCYDDKPTAYLFKYTPIRIFEFSLCDNNRVRVSNPFFSKVKDSELYREWGWNSGYDMKLIVDDIKESTTYDRNLVQKNSGDYEVQSGRWVKKNYFRDSATYAKEFTLFVTKYEKEDYRMNRRKHFSRTYIYLDYETLKPNDELKKTYEEKLLKEKKEKELIELNAYKMSLDTCVKTFGRKWGEFVYKRELKIGMTKEMVLYFLDIPTSISKTTEKNKVTEVWIYDSIFKLTEIVFIKDKVHHFKETIK